MESWSVRQGDGGETHRVNAPASETGIGIGFGMARGFALFLGSFTLLNRVASLGTSNLNTNLVWIDLRTLPGPAGAVLESLLGALLMGFALAPRMHPLRRTVTWVMVAAFLLMAMANAAQVWRLQAEGVIRSPPGVPLSVFAGLGLAGLFRTVQTDRPVPGRRGSMVAGFGLCILAFPILQVFCFGKTDYRRTAQVAVVPGARVYADGRLSDAVADRVRTAAELYREGWVRSLILSGGPGDGTIHETEAMRRYARSLGVPAESISLDPLGVNTAATVRNTRPALDGLRVLVVSEFYHLPRLKMAYAQAGQEVYTVPAAPRHWLRAWPLRSIAREVPAYWAYWLRGLADSIRTA